MELEFGEEICSKCSGSGWLSKYVEVTNTQVRFVCRKCLGSGKVTWLDQMFSVDDKLETYFDEVRICHTESGVEFQIFDGTKWVFQYYLK